MHRSIMRHDYGGRSHFSNRTHRRKGPCCCVISSGFALVSCIVFVRLQVPSGRVAGGLPGEEHQQPGDQLLFAERPDHLDSVPDPGGCLHWSRPGRLQQPCHRVHSAGRWVQSDNSTDGLFYLIYFFCLEFGFKFLILPGTAQT